ncbi:DUF7557 family protein [Natronococcus pandeyae]|uniref:DUF7557 family protein n=1 Tax=Natronococcus pandeyae TaxID=2055836 RepID=UPI0011E76565|nr:hypothetical protein [Natronococcus pandeyae]
MAAHTAQAYLPLAGVHTVVSPTLEINDDLVERVDSHRDEGQSPEEFVAELASIHEAEGTSTREGVTG